MKAPVPAVPALAPLLCALSLVACSGGGGLVVVGTGTGPPPVFLEGEPNDFAVQANYIGQVVVGSHLFVEGIVTDIPLDEADGFSFVAAEPVEIEFRLTLHDPSSDLDLLVWDPFVFDFVATFENDGPELGFFSVLDHGAEFHMVVVPFQNLNGPYTLEVIAHPIAFPFSASLEGGAKVRGPQEAAEGRAPVLEERRRAYAGEADVAPATPELFLREDPQTGEVSLAPLDRD